MSRLIKSGLWITEHRKSGKMINKDSIMFAHPAFCAGRSVGVCGRCYSKRLSSYRPNLAKWQTHNTNVISSPDFVPCLVSTVDDTLRWSSMGELSGDVMYQNICRMAEKNRHITHQIWTKLNGIVKRNKNLRLNNLTLVWSATRIDYQRPFVPDGYQIGFYVYSDESKIPDNVFRCQKSCAECGFCYRPGAYGIVGEVIR